MGEASRLRAAGELAQGMAAAPGPPEAALAAAAGARAALGGSYAALAVWEPEHGRLRRLAATGPAADEAGPAGEASEAGPAGEAGRSIAGEPSRARVERARDGWRLAVPVPAAGRVWGELSVVRDEEFRRADAEFAELLAAVAGAGMAQHERLAQVRRLAFTDPLTGLANRRAVDLRLDEALAAHRATGAVVSLVVCDLNGLKRVNDTYGHATGDRLLTRFGTVLARCGAAVPGALAARLGGDEFCLLAVGAGAEAVERAARELCRRAGELEPGEGVACGVAFTGEATGPWHSARRLFRLADAAQYRAKAARSPAPVIAGREGRGDPVVALADAPAGRGPERRRFRGRREAGTGPADDRR